MEWTLTPDQQRKWQDRWSGLQHGLQAEIAAELKPVKVRSRGKTVTKDLASWKVDLSNFFKGDPKALEKILGNDEVAGVVAKHLKLARAQDLRAEYERIRGIIRDGPFDVRIPGFEDYGPIRARDLYFPLAAGGANGIRVNDSRVEMFPPSLDAVLRACADGHQARSIAVEGSSGLGKSMFIKAVHDALAGAGRRVGVRPSSDIDVLVVDDWEQQQEEFRQKARRWMAPGRVAITTRARELREPELAECQAVLKLTALQPHWVRDYVRQIGPLIADKWGVDLDMVSIESWLEDDPFAYRLISNHRVLGLTLRLAAKGTYPPFTPGTEAELLRGHLVDTTANRLAETYLKVAGKDLLSEFAREALLGSSLGFPLERAATLASTTASRFGARVALDDSGSIGLLNAFSGTTPYQRNKQELVCEAPALALPAMRGRWHEHLPQLVVHPDAAEVLIAAAYSEPDNVLLALLELEPALQCLAMPTLTRVLASPARFTNAGAWLRAFRMCAAWWTHSPKNPAAPGPGVARPATERFGGYSPLTVLALGSVEHSRLFPKDLAPLDLAKDLPAPLKAWLEVYGTEAPSAKEQQAALDYIAPMKAHGFPAIAEIRTTQDWADAAVRGLQPMDWQLWWRRVAVPLWREHPEGERHIAGTAAEASVIPGCNQDSERTLSEWHNALDKRIAAGDDRAPAAIVEAIVFALTRGGGRLQRFLREALRGWHRLRSRVRPLLVERVHELKPCSFLDGEYVWDRQGSLFTRVLIDFLDQSSVEQLWRSWVKTNTDEIPWRSFLMARIPAERVVEWALANGAEGLGIKRSTSFLLAEEVVKPTRRLEALTAIEKSNNVEAIVRIFAGPIPWSMRRRLYGRVQALGPQEAIDARIQAARVADHPQAQPLLLDNLLPRPQDKEAWEELIEDCPDHGERIGRVAQWCAGQSGPDRWNALTKCLDDTEEAWRQAQDNEDVGRTLQGLLMYSGSLLARQLSRDDLPGSEDRHDVLRKVLSSRLWAPLMSEWSQRGVWALAAKLLPEEEFRELLAQDLRSPYGYDSRPAKLGSLIMGGHLDRVVGLLKDPQLGPAAASALSGLTYGNKQWPLEQLQEVLGGDDLREDGVIDQLLLLAVRHGPEDAVNWLTEKLATTPGRAERWWMLVLPAIPPSEARAQAIRAYFAAVIPKSS